MPQYNRQFKRKKSGPTWNWQRAGLGAAGGAAQGFAVGGPWGALLGVPAGIAGGLTGVDKNVDRVAYDRALMRFSDNARSNARIAGNQQAADTGASFASRGLNASELAGGVVAANKGRLRAGAERAIGDQTANVEMKIAEREAALEREDAGLTQQYLGQTFRSLFDLAVAELGKAPKPTVPDRKRIPIVDETPREPFRPKTIEPIVDPGAPMRPGEIPPSIAPAPRFDPRMPATTTVPKEYPSDNTIRPLYDRPRALREPDSSLPSPSIVPPTPGAPTTRPNVSPGVTAPTAPRRTPSPKAAKLQKVVGPEDMAQIRMLLPDIDEILA